MVDPSSLLENGSHAWMYEEHLGELVINTDFDPTHRYDLRWVQRSDCNG